MNLSAIHKAGGGHYERRCVVCDIGGYEFVSYSQAKTAWSPIVRVVCDIGGYEFVSYSQGKR